MADRAVAGRDPEQLPAGRPRPPRRATTPRTGRTKARAPAPQRIVFGNVRPATTRGTTSREDLGRRRGRESSGAPRRSCPRGASTTTRSATSTFWAFAKPSATFVGFPSGVERVGGRRADHLRDPIGLPLRQAPQDHRQAAGRGVGLDGGRRQPFLPEGLAEIPRASSSRAGSSAGAGISSVRISKRKSCVFTRSVGPSALTEGRKTKRFSNGGRLRFRERGPLLPRRCRNVGPRARAGEIANPAHDADAVGRGDGPARVEDVELVRADERRLVGGEHEARVQAAPRLAPRAGRA